MAYRNAPVSLEYDDDDILDQMAGDYTPPSYPYGCAFTLSEDDLERAAGERGKPGDTLGFMAMAEVTSVYAAQTSRIELAIKELAGDDGKFFTIKACPDGKEDETWSRFGCVCLTTSEMDKMGLDGDAYLGDLIHLIGELQVQSIRRTDEGDVATVQITHLTFAENESDEAGEG